MKRLRWFVLPLLLVLAGPVLALLSGQVDLNRHWAGARRDSIGISPAPDRHPEAVVQVFAARAFGWRGLFGVHTWIAVKPQGADHYTIHQVLGWRARYGGSAVDSGPGTPDRHWYGNPPTLVGELYGPAAEQAIGQIEAAVATYPYPHDYTLWPGPNSNTFVAHVARQVPALQVDLPATAIGKDYLPGGSLVAQAPSGTGYQVSLAGLLGATLALEEGLELNVLGLGFGIDLNAPALRLPGLGRLGFSR